MHPSAVPVPIPVSAARRLWHRLAGWWRHPSPVETALARVRALHDLPPDLTRDTGLSPQEATGIAPHQPDLPFFLQPGFGRR